MTFAEHYRGSIPNNQRLADMAIAGVVDRKLTIADAQIATAELFQNAGILVVDAKPGSSGAVYIVDGELAEQNVCVQTLKFAPIELRQKLLEKLPQLIEGVNGYMLDVRGINAKIFYSATGNDGSQDIVVLNAVDAVVKPEGWERQRYEAELIFEFSAFIWDSWFDINDKKNAINIFLKAIEAHFNVTYSSNSIIGDTCMIIRTTIDGSEIYMQFSPN